MAIVIQGGQPKSYFINLIWLLTFPLSDANIMIMMSFVMMTYNSKYIDGCQRFNHLIPYSTTQPE